MLSRLLLQLVPSSPPTGAHEDPAPRCSEPAWKPPGSFRHLGWNLDGEALPPLLKGLECGCGEKGGPSVACGARRRAGLRYCCPSRTSVPPPRGPLGLRPQGRRRSLYGGNTASTHSKATPPTVNAHKAVSTNRLAFPRYSDPRGKTVSEPVSVFINHKAAEHFLDVGLCAQSVALFNLVM